MTMTWSARLPGPLGNAEKARQLRNNDMHGNAGQEASYHATPQLSELHPLPPTME
jgi:hypothetical protein